MRNSWWFVGATLTLLFACLCNQISYYFAWAILLGDRPIVLFVILLVCANIIFGIWFFVASACEINISENIRYSKSKTTTFWRIAAGIFIVGILARIILLPSVPILEDDFYRYMWDGAVTANGLNPYLHAPDSLAVAPEVAELLNSLAIDARPLPADYADLAKQGEDTLLRINNPNIATIYPPVAQLGFALAYLISPFDLMGLKIVSILAEIITYILLTLALFSNRNSASPLVLYWWHPLVLKEFSNSVHMDVMLMPFLAFAILMIVSRRKGLAQFAFGLAAAVKIWPLMLIPLISSRNIRSIANGCGCVMITILLILPQLLALDEGSGLTRFGQDWQRNALAFPLLQNGLFFWSDAPDILIRIFILSGFVLLITRIWWRQNIRNIKAGKGFLPLYTPPENFITCIIIVLSFFWLLLPTGYPWYTLWLLPFLVIKPNFAAILLTLASAFYYYDFAIQLMDDPGIITWLPAFLCAAPVWLALALSWRKYKAIAYG